MKLAMRPKNRPIGATGAIRSPSFSMSIFCWRANSSDRRADAQEAAVERHAALPDLEDVQRVGEQPRALVAVHQHVEEDVAEPPADDDAQGDPQHQVVDLQRRGRRRAAAPQAAVRVSGVAKRQPSRMPAT
jgi:hypothetical protein